MNYTADVNAFLGQITEVDMTSAGMTVIRCERLLPETVIARILAMPKLQQSIAVGKLSRLPAFANLANAVTKGIGKRVEEILRVNDITQDRILSIKRDAVFVTGPAPARLSLGDGTTFKIKNSYTSFVKLGTVEAYCVPRRSYVDLKGIPVEKRELHKDYITRFVLDVMMLLERGSTVEAAHTIQNFKRDYCAKKLPIGFYREFNSTSCLAMMGGARLFQLEGCGTTSIALQDLEIAYNLHAVIIPLSRTIA